jgi:hypothetical protein
VHSDNGLVVNGFNNHLDGSDAPDVIGVSDIDFVSYINLINLLLELPSDILTLLRLPANLDISLFTIGNKLLNNIINTKATEEHRSFGSPDRLVTDKAALLHDKVLINTLCTERVATNGGLTLVNKLEAEGTDEGLRVWQRVQGHAKRWRGGAA